MAAQSRLKLWAGRFSESGVSSVGLVAQPEISPTAAAANVRVKRCFLTGAPRCGLCRYAKRGSKDSIGAGLASNGGLGRDRGRLTEWAGEQPALVRNIAQQYPLKDGGVYSVLARGATN